MIPRKRIEGELEEILKSAQPTPALASVAQRMFKDLWKRKLKQADGYTAALSRELGKLDKQIAQLLDRILETGVPSVVKAYEQKIQALEKEKLSVQERMENLSRPATSFEDTLRTALGFLANPWNLWSSGRLEDRKTVLKLVFADQLQYAPKEGFRTANLSLPFKVLGDFCGGENRMARPKGFEPLTPRFVVWCK